MNMNENEDFSGLSLFTEVKDKVVQAYNRFQVVRNLTEAGLDNVGLEYIGQLDPEDRMRLAMLTEYVKRKGMEETTREVLARAA